MPLPPYMGCASASAPLVANLGGGCAGFPGPDAVREVKVGLCWPSAEQPNPKTEQGGRSQRVWGLGRLPGWVAVVRSSGCEDHSQLPAGGVGSGTAGSALVPPQRPLSTWGWAHLSPPSGVLEAAGHVRGRRALPAQPPGSMPGMPAHTLLPAWDLHTEASALATVSQGQVRAPAGPRELPAMTPHSQVSGLCLWTCSGCCRQAWGLLCVGGSGAAQ